MLPSLPTVEAACCALQQEESQSYILTTPPLTLDSSVMYSKGMNEKDVCTTCGVKGHVSERCWTVVGYPKWHPKHNARGRTRESSSTYGGTRKPLSIDSN